MAQEEEASKSAKILYRPIGLTSSIVGGLLTGLPQMIGTRLPEYGR